MPSRLPSFFFDSNPADNSERRVPVSGREVPTSSTVLGSARSSAKTEGDFCGSTARTARLVGVVGAFSLLHA